MEKMNALIGFILLIPAVALLLWLHLQKKHRVSGPLNLAVFFFSQIGGLLLFRWGVLVLFKEILPGWEGTASRSMLRALPYSISAVFGLYLIALSWERFLKSRGARES